jgi:hypothetical protein
MEKLKRDWPVVAGHDWWVYSTALKERWMMLRCSWSGATGTVRRPSEEEWAAAFHAPSRPYRWPVELDFRVTVDPSNN